LLRTNVDSEQLTTFDALFGGGARRVFEATNQTALAAIAAAGGGSGMLFGPGALSQLYADEDDDMEAAPASAAARRNAEGASDDEGRAFDGEAPSTLSRSRSGVGSGPSAAPDLDSELLTYNLRLLPTLSIWKSCRY
jgi:stringent starvation protein B